MKEKKIIYRRIKSLNFPIHDFFFHLMPSYRALSEIEVSDKLEKNLRLTIETPFKSRRRRCFRGFYKLFVRIYAFYAIILEIDKPK